MSLPYAFSPNIWPAIIASLMMFTLAVYSFRHRAMPGALSFAIACTFGLLWTIGSILEYTALDFAVKVFWCKFQVLFQLPSATAITCFLLEYAWPKRFLTRRNLLILWAAPVAAIIVIVTNDFHRLFWEDFITNGRLVAVPGPLMKLFLAYVFLNFAINLTIFTWLFIHSPQNRWPVVIMVTGQILMRVLYFIDIGKQNLSNLSYASVGIAITSLLYAVVFFRFQILGPIPLARQAVTNQLPIGMLVLDDQARILSLNPAAEQMLQIHNKAAKKMEITELLPVFEEHNSKTIKNDPIEFSLTHQGGARVYTLAVSSLEDWRAQQVGQLLLITDVTAQR